LWAPQSLRTFVREFTHEASPKDGDPTRRAPRPIIRTVVVMSSLAVLAGSVSTVLFAVSTLPMLIKAARSKDLDSYSRGNLVLANTGNAVHSVYVFQLPPGPIWALHAFYIIASGLMLFWHLRYAKRKPRRWSASRRRQVSPVVESPTPPRLTLAA
jgi:uncharacterized protein with PQ loop repeat